MSSSCGMYSTQAAFGTAAVSDTCSSIRKCGQTETLNASARCATLSHGVTPADPGTIDLHDRARIAFEIFAKMRGMIERFADRDRNRRMSRQFHVTAQIFGRQRLLEPREAEGLEGAGAANRLGHGEALIGVDHDFERVAHRFAYGQKPRDVLGHVRLADFELRAAEALCLRLQRLCDQRFHRQMQPPAFGRVHRDLRLRAAGDLPQWQPRARVQRRSHSAVSMAARARLVIAPTAVACVWKKRSFQIASMHSGSRPMSFGARWSRSSATTDEPPVPIVYV